MKTVNLKEGMPLVREAFLRLDHALAAAKGEGQGVIKLIHGYGSSGTGGEIRIAVQRHLREMTDSGQIRGCILGEDWVVSNEQTWKIIKTHPELKGDRDLGGKNPGITIVLL
jgi:hypothetical protein